MYLSLIKIDVKSYKARQCLSNAYDMHRSILSWFDDISSDTPRKDLGVVYRLVASSKAINLYVLSSNEPKIDKIHESGFDFIDKKDISHVSENLINGRQYAFDLLACSTKKEKSEGKNSKRVFLKTREERLEWLRRKGEQNGFRLVSVEEKGQEKFRINKKSISTDEIHTGVRFCGELEVIDETLFKNAFENGIGPGKSFGFGMLMLYPKGKFIA